jgi:hypothetical protein
MEIAGTVNDIYFANQYARFMMAPPKRSAQGASVKLIIARGMTTALPESARTKDKTPAFPFLRFEIEPSTFPENKTRVFVCSPTKYMP